MSNRLFYLSIILSFLIHVSFLLGLYQSKKKPFKLKEPKKIEVVYTAVKPSQAQPAPSKMKDSRVFKREIIEKDIKIRTKKADKFSEFGDKFDQPSKSTQKIRLDKKKAPRVDLYGAQRKITVPLLKSEKITNPKYLGYTEKIRDRIKRRANRYVNHPDISNGKVYLTFIIRSDGQLLRSQIIEEKSFANRNLREIGLSSIEEAGPFPPFPSDLTYPELTFNIVISFEVDE